MEDNNIQDSCCNSKYASIRQMDKLDEMLGRRFPFYPRTVIQAVHDGRTGASLEAILAQYNNIYVQYQGTAGRTRNIVPKEMRRKGIIISYVDMQGNAITEKCVNDAQRDNFHWGLDVNWVRVDELTLSGDISVSVKGTWVINGEDTGIAALGPKGDNGLTPWLKTIDNKLHFSYDNETWEVCSDYIAAYFRFQDNKFQISRDNKTWSDLSGEVTNSLSIKAYVTDKSQYPNPKQGDMIMVGPTYADDDTEHTKPIYHLNIYNAGGWVDHGPFQSINAGVVQELGDSETEVMSQKAVSEKFSELNDNLMPIDISAATAVANIMNLTKEQVSIYSILENTILYPTKINTNFPNYNVHIFDVSNIDVVQIICSEIKASGNSLAFAFYKNLELTSDGYIRGISFIDLGTRNVNKFLNVPLDAMALAISDRADFLPTWTINKIELGDSRIEENTEKIAELKGLKNDIYPIGNDVTTALSNIFKTTQTPLLVDSTIENSLMRADGSLWSNFADHNLQLYAVSDIDIIRVECAEIKASGKTLAFAFYKESEITVGNFIWGISYDDLGRRDLNDYLYVPQGAKYLVICDRNDFLPTWTINKIELGDSRIEENVVEIACWGDSITAGTATPNYPTWLQKLLNTTVINLGCGSAWIQDISARQGGVPALILSEVSVPSTTEPFAMDYNNVYNAYQSKEFQLAPRYQIENAELAYNPVIIDNVEFNFKFSYDNGVKLHISRLVGGKEFTIRKGTPIYPNSISKYRDWFNVFFMGTNNTSGYNTDLSAYTETIISYHDDCISMLNTANYLVLGLFNIGQRIYNRDEAEKLTPTDAEILEQYITYETKMRKTYGLRFIALRELLASQKSIDDAVSLGYMTQVQATTNQTIDQEWIAKGCVPKSFMVYSGNDYVHPNAVGYKMIAYYVSLAIKKMIGLK